MVHKLVLTADALVRLIGIILLILAGLLTATTLFFTLGKKWHLTLVGKNTKQRWMKLACLLLRIEIDRFGNASTKPVLIAANHLSWVDILVLGAVTPCTFVAKSNVRQWPAIGVLAGISGTLFVDRDNRRNAKLVVDDIVDTLDGGGSVVIFPEGTTTVGIDLEGFFPLLFEAAVRGRYPLQSAALYYPENMSSHSHVPFIGEQSFGPHLLRFLYKGRTPVEVFFCSPLPIRDEHKRKDLADISQAQVSHILKYREQYSPYGEALYRELDAEMFLT